MKNFSCILHKRRKIEKIIIRRSNVRWITSNWSVASDENFSKKSFGKNLKSKKIWSSLKKLRKTQSLLLSEIFAQVVFKSVVDGRKAILKISFERSHLMNISQKNIEYFQCSVKNYLLIAIFFRKTTLPGFTTQGWNKTLLVRQGWVQVKHGCLGTCPEIPKGPEITYEVHPWGLLTYPWAQTWGRSKLSIA